MEKKSILVVLFFSIICLLVINFFLSYNSIKPILSNALQKVNFVKAKPTEAPLIFPQVPARRLSGLPMFLPVRREDLKTIPEVRSDHLIFFLPDGAPIYALIDGKIERYVPANPPKVPFENIQLVSLDGRFIASYLIEGKILVEEGQGIKRGNLIARAKKDKGIPCLGGGNLGIYLSDNHEPVILDKESLEEVEGIEGK